MTDELARIDREIAACLQHPGGPWPLWLLAIGWADWEAERWLLEREERQ